LTAAQYIKSYREAQQAFVAVPGNDFEYVWDLSAGFAMHGRTEFDTYPGNAYVTDIGFDWYDYNPATKTGVTPSVVPPILTFAANHDKPVSIDEWAMNGVDDPAFVNYVASVVQSPYDRVSLQVYFDSGPSTLSSLPKAERAYVKDFG
jgi:beta-mannanase